MLLILRVESLIVQQLEPVFIGRILFSSARPWLEFANPCKISFEYFLSKFLVSQPVPRISKMKRFRERINKIRAKKNKIQQEREEDQKSRSTLHTL